MVQIPDNWLDMLQVRPLIKPIIPPLEVPDLPPSGEVAIFTLFLKNDHNQYFAFYQSLVSPKGTSTEVWRKLADVSIGMNYWMSHESKKALVMNTIDGSNNKEPLDQNWKPFYSKDLIPLKDWLMQQFRVVGESYLHANS